jgi:parallel beta-helix repeat protein
MKSIISRIFAVLLVVLLSISSLEIRDVKAQNTISISSLEIRDVKAQNTIIINLDGTITGTNKIIQNENSYILTDNITGSGIQVQKNNIILDGAGYTIQGNKEVDRIGVDLSNDRGQDPSRPEITNITIKNTQIINFNKGINNHATNNNKIIGNYIADCETGINVGGNPNNVLIESNTFVDNVNGISIVHSGGNQTITKNNMIQNEVPTNNIIIVWLSYEPNVYNNYWNDYTGLDTNEDAIGDTPYWYIDVDYAKYADNEPLMEPVPLEFSTWILPTPKPTQTPSITPSPTPSPTPIVTPTPTPTHTYPKDGPPPDLSFIVPLIGALIIIVVGSIILVRINRKERRGKIDEDST